VCVRREYAKSRRGTSHARPPRSNQDVTKTCRRSMEAAAIWLAGIEEEGREGYNTGSSSSSSSSSSSTRPLICQPVIIPRDDGGGCALSAVKKERVKAVLGV
jgi:hypothetical protein